MLTSNDCALRNPTQARRSPAHQAHSRTRHLRGLRGLHAIRVLALTLLASLLLAACDIDTSTSTPTSTTADRTPTLAASSSTNTSTRVTATAIATGADTDTGTATDLPVDGLEQALVERVVDGDTLIVWRDGQAHTERLRYIGVDTPESVDPNRPVECYGPEASDANADLVEGAVIWLERDVSDTDQYGRLLRYVYVEQDGELLFVNQELIRQGMATTVTFPPDTRYSDVLRAAQADARNAERGLWGACTP